MFTRDCEVCGKTCYRKKKCESERKTWRFCGRRCVAIYYNKKRKKDIDGYKKCLWCGKDFPYRKTLLVRSCKGVASVKQQFCSHNCALTYRNKSQKQRDSSSQRMKGAGSPFWRGGISNANKAFRETREYKVWRQGVFHRDDFRCIDCGVRNEKGSYIKLQVHHIYNYALYPRLRLMPENGITICEDCHKKTDDYLKHYPKSAYVL